jgi:FdhD protein
LVARRRTISTLARRIAADGVDSAPRPGRSPEDVLVEEPLEIRRGDELVATTMRTPGHDFELAVGFLWAEGLISGAPSRVRYCATGSAVDTGFNVVTVEPAAGDRPGGDGSASGLRPRLGLVSSSCGICGTEQVDELVDRLDPLPATPGLSQAELFAAGGSVAGAQELFESTGGSHAAAAVDLRGNPLGLAEDIGRHNAVDKLVGRLLLADSLPVPGDPSRAGVLWVSGRASFEMVQKAWAAGFSALVAVGAVSSLAVGTAERAGLVLAGFARSDHATVYASAGRLAPEGATGR